ncbi:MAG: glycosyltransferase family 4 protein [Bacteroidales bacterium]|jgi:glycosyltransferase involved in cell wall biosynthesis|nr:glycosyltransferase family 4 protein [Bacteroidales bacterium]
MHIVQSGGGVHRYLSMLLSNVNKDLFKNILVCSQNYNMEDYRCITDEIEQITMCREISLVKDLTAIRKIRHFINLYNPDIVYCHSSKGGALGRLATLGIKNKPKIIYTPHGWSFNMRVSKFKRTIYIFIEKLLARYTDYIIAVSEAEKTSALSNKICKENQMKLIYSGVEVNKIQQTKTIEKKALNIPQDAYIVGIAARISEQKAPDIFVESARLIKQQIPEAYFIIVGDGELRASINELIMKYKLSDSFLITGWVSDAIPYLGLFDVAVLTSRWEAFGLVLVEYMAVGKPIVATNTDAIPYLIENEKNGLLVLVDNPKSVCNAVMTIRNNPPLREKLVKNGLEMAKDKFDIMRVVEEHERLFQQLIQ